MTIEKRMLIYSIANVLNAAVPFFLLPILTSYLTPYDYGKLSIVQTLQTVLTPLVMLNFYAIVSVEFSKISNTELPSFIGSILWIPMIGFSLVLGLCLLCSHFIIAYFPISYKWIVLVVILIFFQSVTVLLPTIYQSSHNPVAYGIYKVSMTLFNLLLSILLLVQTRGNWEWVLYAALITYALFSLVGLIIMFSNGWLRISFKKTYLVTTLKFGVPLVPHVFAGTLLVMSDRFIITSMLGAHSLGIYSVAFQVAMAINIITTSINQAWTPHLFDKLNQSRDMQTKAHIVGTVYRIMLTMVAIEVLFLICVPLVFRFFINTNYGDAVGICMLMSVGFLFQGFYFMMTNFMFYIKRTFILSFLTMLSVILTIGLNYTLIPIFGLYGSAVSMLFGWLFFFIIVWYISAKLFYMPWASWKKTYAC